MKLIRDRTPDLLRGSTRPVRDIEEHQILVQAKLMEEAAECAAATSVEEFVLEAGDVFEQLLILMTIWGVTIEQIDASIADKQKRKGTYVPGVVLMHDPLSNKTTATI